MKRQTLPLILAVAALAIVGLQALRSGESAQPGQYEYVTIRWGGRDNTHIIRPGGVFESIGAQLRGVERHDRADERAFYMNVAMNGLVKEGYEFAGITDDMIIMRRPSGQ